MDRKSMLEELLERLELELDELNNSQLSTLLSEYEHIPLLGNVIESISDLELDDELDEEDSKEDYNMIDDEVWEGEE